MNEEKSYNKGVELYEEKKYGEAIRVLLDAYSDDNNDVDVVELLAECHIRISDFTDAARWLLIANKIDVNNPRIKYNLCYALLCMGRLNDAMKYAQECLKLNPPNEIKRMAERMIKSKEYFTDKLENNCDISLDEEFECYEKFREAQKYLYENRFEEAIDIYEGILEKKPDFHQAIQNIGVCYIQEGKPEKAVQYFEKAISISPKDALCLGNLAHAHYLLSNLEKSKEYSKKCMTSVKDLSLRDLIRLVILFIDIKQFEFSRKLLDSYEKTYNNSQLTFLSGVLYAKQKEYASAKEEFNKIKQHSEIAEEYVSKCKQLIEGTVKEYAFEPKMAIDAEIDLL